MKIYVDDPSGDKPYLICPDVEIHLTKTEFNILTDGMIKFKDRMENYIKNNPDEEDLGTSHMHYKLINDISEKSDADIVLYVDMNSARDEKQETQEACV